MIFFALMDGSIPMDLSSTLLRWRAGPGIDAGQAEVEKTSPSGGLTILNPTQGQCQLSISESDVPESGLWYHAMEGNTSSAGWQELLRGRIVVTPGMGAP